MAKQITGTVVSDKADKTIVISARERRTHPLYKKQYTVNTKFIAHDEKNEAKAGDLVIITETRPISARKHFKLEKILEKSGAHFEEADATADIPEEESAQPAPQPKAKPAPAEAKEEVKESKEEKK
jgi:small subunit ribosomal protein S17